MAQAEFLDSLIGNCYVCARDIWDWQGWEVVKTTDPTNSEVWIHRDCLIREGIKRIQEGKHELPH